MAKIKRLEAGFNRLLQFYRNEKIHDAGAKHYAAAQISFLAFRYEFVIPGVAGRK